MGEEDVTIKVGREGREGGREGGREVCGVNRFRLNCFYFPSLPPSLPPLPQVADEGGGVPRSDLRLLWTFFYTTFPPSIPSSPAPLAAGGAGGGSLDENVTVTVRREGGREEVRDLTIPFSLYFSPKLKQTNK